MDPLLLLLLLLLCYFDEILCFFFPFQQVETETTENAAAADAATTTEETESATEDVSLLPLLPLLQYQQDHYGDNNTPLVLPQQRPQGDWDQYEDNNNPLVSQSRQPLHQLQPIDHQQQPPQQAQINKRKRVNEEEEDSMNEDNGYNEDDEESKQMTKGSMLEKSEFPLAYVMMNNIFMGQGPLLEIYRHKETNLPQKFQIVYRRKSYKIKKEEIKEIAYNISNPKDRRIQFIAIKLKPLSPVFNCMMVDKFTDSHQPQDDIHSNAQIGANILCVMNHNLVYKILSKETDFYTLKIDEWISCSDFSQVADDVYFRYTQVLNQNWISLSKAERVYSVSILSKKPRKNSLTSSSSSRSSSLSSSLSSSNTVSSPNVLLDRNVVCDEEKDVQHQGAMKVEAAEEVDEGQEEQPETLALSQLLQEISEDDLTTVKNAWNYGKASLVEVVSLPCGVLGSPVPILGKNMQRMEKGWLEDVIINGYMWLLHKRDQKLCAANPDRKPCHFFPSFFMAKAFHYINFC
jgi:hypothetical protein